MQKSRIFGSLTLSKLFIVLCAIFTFSTNNASAAICSATPGTALQGTPIIGSIVGCSSYGTYLFGSTYFYSCSACTNGSAPLTATVTATNCDNTTTRGYCSVGTISNCTSDSDCSSGTTSWAAKTTGYQSRSYGKCVNSNCSTVEQVRCAAGYYGASPTCTTGGMISCNGCTRCPNDTIDNTSVQTTSDAGTEVADCCYVGTSTTISDTSGSYKYTSKCYKAPSVSNRFCSSATLIQ